MISVLNFKNLCSELAGSIPAINETLLVSHETHASAKLKDKVGVILMAIIPSADRSGQSGGGIDDNVTWFFVLEKVPDDQTDEEELVMYERLQKVILEVRSSIEDLHDDGDIRLRRYRPGSNTIDPEYKEFGGFSGWSMSAVF